MTTKQADRLIKTGEVVLFNSYLGDTFYGKVIRRHRSDVYISWADTASEVGEAGQLALFSRTDIQIVKIVK